MGTEIVTSGHSFFVKEESKSARKFFIISKTHCLTFHCHLLVLLVMAGVAFRLIAILLFHMGFTLLQAKMSWIFWVGPLIGAALAAGYHQIVLRAGVAKALASFRSSNRM